MLKHFKISTFKDGQKWQKQIEKQLMPYLFYWE